MTLEISEHIVNVGNKVRIKWLDEWHEGIIIDLTPQNNLYQVTESRTELPVILHVSQIKPIDSTRSTHEKYNLGAEVAFYDSNLREWQSGIIKVKDVAASILVKWNRSKDQVENLNWFMENDVAPVIENEVFSRETNPIDQTTSDNTVAILPLLEITPSVQDILEEKPVFRQNHVFDSHNETTDNNPLEYHLPDFDQFVEEFNQPQRTNKRRTSVSMKEFYAKRFQKPAPKKADSKGLHEYLENQHALLQGKLDHSVLPAIWSYLQSAGGKGIPHHPASNFFSFHDSNMKRTQSSMLPPHLSRSTTMTSRHSEPAVSRSRNPLKKIKDRRMRKQATDISLRPLPPPPTSEDYEVPISTSAVNGNSTSVEKDNSNSKLYDNLNFTKSKSNNQGLEITAASPKKQIVSAGGSVTLFCEVKSDTPVTYEWYKDGGKLTHNDEQVAFPAPGKIQLYGLNIRNAGRYQCRISNTAQMSENFDCILKVEEDTIRRSFSRELGLHKLAFEDSPQNGDTISINDFEQQANNVTSSASLPNFDEDDKDLSQVPSYNINQFSFLKSPSSMDLTRELLEKDVQRLEQEGLKMKREPESKEKLRSAQVSKSTIDERLVHKEKRRKSSNVIISEMDTYLDGYGKEYGKSSHVLDAPDEINKTSRKDKKKKSKQSKSGKKKKKTKSPKKQNVGTELMNGHPPSNKVTDEEKYIEELDTVRPTEVEIEEIEVHAYLESSNDEIMPPPIDYGDQDDVPSYDQVMEEKIIQKTKTITDIRQGGSKSALKMNSATAKHNMVAKSNDSIDAHPEYESLTSVSSGIEEEETQRIDTGSKKGSSNVDLPLAVEHYTESIKRLQKSTQEYEKERFGKDIKKPQQSLLKKILKSNNTELN